MLKPYVLLLLLCGLATGQTPDIIHYTFNNGTAENTAIPGVGDGTLGGGIVFSPSNSCTGNGGLTAVTDGFSKVDTGWLQDLGSNSWTIGMHLDLNTGGGGYQFFFGDFAFGIPQLACYTGAVGTAAEDAVVLRVPGEIIAMQGALAQSNSAYVVWVYDNTIPEVRGYLNGALATTRTLTAPLNMVVGMTNFQVMGNSAFAMASGNKMDDFRLYRRAISVIEITAWNKCGGTSIGDSYCNPAVINSTGQPGRLTAIGSEVVNRNDFTLQATQVPNGQFAMFLASRVSGLVVGPGGSQGNLCVINNIAFFRAPGQVGAITGSMFRAELGLISFPEPPNYNVSVLAGETWNFQCWYRDWLPTSGPTSNFTEAISVTFL